ncbi:serine/threonine-rich hypothetical protein [Schistosoma mansoni]|nr:serine/threonine-rich hypothetical protein [Schistosoma mansoni]|eukprot:XP_018654889.1 serine/threonine-rich hypothetical protein [Schistosoma mansoni]
MVVDMQSIQTQDDTIPRTRNASHGNDSNISILIKPEANDSSTSHVHLDNETVISSSKTVSSMLIHDGDHTDNLLSQKTSICKAISSVRNDIQTSPNPAPGPSQTVCISNVIGASADFMNSKYRSPTTSYTPSDQNRCFRDISVNRTSGSQIGDLHSLSVSSRRMTIIQETPLGTHHYPSIPLSLSTNGLSESYNEDPVLREYVHKKCTLLRYPIQLALAMSKLCSPSKLSDKQANFSEFNKTSPRQLSDHGYMEIDASHFTLNPSAILAKNNTVMISNMNRPRTKAQLRHLSVNKPSHPSEKTTQDFASQSENKITQSKESQSHTPITNESDVIEILSDEEEKCGPSTPHYKNPCALKSNQLRHRSRQFCKNLRKTTRPSTLYRSQVTPNYKWKLRSTEDSAGLRLVSSLDFDRDPEAKLSQTPHWVYTYASRYEKSEMKSHLLLGDVLRILYLLLVNRKNQLVLRNVLKHCRHYCRRIPSGDIHIYTSTGLSPLRSISLPHYSCTVSKSTRLFIVHWYSDNILKEILAVTYSCLPSHETWYSCCPKMLLHTLSYLIFKPDAKKRILNFAKTFSIKHGQISSALSLLPIIQTNQNDSTNSSSVHDLHDGHHDLELYTKLSDCLPKSLTTILETNIGLPIYHIAGFGLLINSFYNTCIHVFTGTKPSVHCNFNLPSDERLCVNLFIIMQHLHQAVSICLCRLRDSYASLMSAGACLRARYELSKTHCSDTQQLPYLRIARGRARLFESEAVARDNIGRIFIEEVNPHILNLINLLERTYHSLRQLTRNAFLFGPLYSRNIMSCNDENLTLLNSKQWVIKSLKYIEKLVHLSTVIPKFNFSLFVETSFRLFEYLTIDVTRHLHLVMEKVLSFKNRLSQTYTSITNSWIPAYKGLSTEVNSRADIDLKYFFSSLQGQYDVIEVWTRRQHEAELRSIGNEMINLLKTLGKCWNCQWLCRNLKLPCPVLSIPYGSKNNSSHLLLKEPGITSLSSWPPVHTSFILTQHVVRTKPQEHTNQNVSSLSSDTQEFVYSKLTFSQDTSTKMPSSNENIDFPSMVNNNSHKADACHFSLNNNFVCETLSSDQVNVTSDLSVESPVPQTVSYHSPNYAPDTYMLNPSDQFRPFDRTTNTSTFASSDLCSHRTTEKLSTTKSLPTQSTIKNNSNLLNSDIRETKHSDPSSFVTANSPLVTCVSNSRSEFDLTDINEKSSKEAVLVESCVQNLYKPCQDHPTSILSDHESKKCADSVDTQYFNAHSETDVNQDYQITDDISSPLECLLTVSQDNDPLFQNNAQISFTPTFKNLTACDTNQMENGYSGPSSVVVNHSITFPEIGNTVIPNSSNSLQKTCNKHAEIPPYTSPSIFDKDNTTGNSASPTISPNNSDTQNSKSKLSQPPRDAHDLNGLLDESVSVSASKFDLPTSSNSCEPVSMNSKTICDHHAINSISGVAFAESQRYSCPPLEENKSSNNFSFINNKISKLMGSTDMCKKQSKEKSIKKVCIYLSDRAITNSPTKDIVSHCNNEENHEVSDEPDTCIMSLDRRRAAKLKRKFKKINHSTLEIQASTTSSDISDTSQTILVNGSETASKDIQSMNNIYNMPITNSSLSFEGTLLTSCNSTNIDKTHSVNKIEPITPWLKEKYLHPQAPGPITAAILGQSVPVLSSDISIDLTVDD